MKKAYSITPLLIILCMLVMMPIASAKMVQVSDLGAYRFVEQMNSFGKSLRTPITFEKPLHVGKMRPDSPYDIYITGQKYAVLSMFCNQAGYVSKIIIQTPDDNPEGCKNAVMLCAISLLNLGLSKSEFDVLWGRRLMARHSSDVWCTAANRRIVLEIYPSRGLDVIRITAYDQ